MPGGSSWEVARTPSPGVQGSGEGRPSVAIVSIIGGSGSGLSDQVGAWLDSEFFAI